MQVGSKDAVLYHIGLLAGNALIVKVEGAPVAAEGAVVYDLHAFGANLLSHLVGKDGSPFAVEIGLEGVAHGLVKEDAGSPGAHHNGHLSSLGAFGGKTVVYAFHYVIGHLLRQALR